MEVFGVIAGVAGLADVGSRLSLRLREVARSWIDAPNEILALNNEIADLAALLRFTEDACERTKDAYQNESFVTALDSHVCTARQLLEEVEDVVELLASAHGMKQKRKWVRTKESVLTKKEKLKTVRIKIRDLLELYQMLTAPKLQLELASVKLELRSGASAASNNLRSMLELMETVNSNVAYMRESADQQTAIVKGIEQAVSNMASASKLGANLSFPPLSGKDSTSRVTEPVGNCKDNNTFSIWAVYRHRTCTSGCICACHTARNSTRRFSSPGFLRDFMGSLFAAYTVIPGLKGAVACDTPMCHRELSKTWEIAYEFPMWFANWSMHALIHNASTGSPMLSLVLRKRVEHRFDGIFRAVDSNNIEAIRAILQRNPDSINYKVDRNGFTPLHFACLRPTKISFSVFRLLLRAGADVDAKNDSGRSAMSYVAGHMVLGGFPDLHTDEISRWVSPSRIVDELELSPVTEVAVGLRVGNITSMLRTLTTRRLKLTEFDSTGSTPLCWASKAGNLEAIQAMVNVGAVDINQCTSTGNTALMCSFALHNPRVGELIDWLLDNGADPLQQNHDGYNVFTLACYLGRFDVVQQLLKRGVDPDVRDGRARTGLSCAIPYDHDHIVRFLYKLGADVNAVNARGFVPLMVATGYNAHRCLQMLLFEAKADYLFHAQDGWNILLHAGSCGDTRTLEILSQHGLAGLDIHARSSNLTAEGAFFSRPATASQSTVTAFKALLAIVEKKTKMCETQGDVEMEEDADEVYFDALAQMTSDLL